MLLVSFLSYSIVAVFKQISLALEVRTGSAHRPVFNIWGASTLLVLMGCLPNISSMYCMTPTRNDLRAWGSLIKTIFKNFPDIYTHLGTNLHYIPIVISKSAHPNTHK
jgi:hypothetical protein